MALNELREVANFTASARTFKFSSPESAITKVTNFNLVTLRDDTEEVIGHVSFAEDGAEGLLVGATLGKTNINFEFRYNPDGLIT